MARISFRDLSIRSKLLLGFGAVISVILFFGLYLIGSLGITRQSLVTLNQQVDILHYFSRLESDSQILLSATRTYILTQDPHWEKIYDDTSLKLDSSLVELRKIALDSEDLEALNEYEEIVNKLQGVELLIVARTNQGQITRAQELFNLNYQTQQTRASLLLGEVVEKERTEVATTIGNSSKLLTSVQITFAAVVLILMIATIVLSLVLTNNISHSIQRLLTTVKAITSGDLTQRVRIESGDEIGHLARNFNRMADHLQGVIEDTKSKSKQLKLQNIELERTKAHLGKAVNRLIRLDKVKSEFVSVAAHQLRTPLTGLKWSLHALTEENTGDLNKSQKRIVKDALGATIELVDLVNELLNVARLEEKRLGFSFTKQPFLPLVKKAIDHFQRSAKKKDLSLAVDFPTAELPPLSIDSKRMTLVLHNLLDNAVKYTPPGGKITLKVAQQKEQVKVTVTDTGIGIPQDQFHRVFTKFFRSKNAQLSETKGTGLGLYLAKQIIERHGGTISFTSNEGKGSTFFFTLPLTGPPTSQQRLEPNV